MFNLGMESITTWVPQKGPQVKRNVGRGWKGGVVQGFEMLGAEVAT